MLRLRATFKKTGRAKYISHLDLNRCMLRIFHRSKLPVWYTEGFNPHPYYSFALALSLGFESDCEIMDFNITDDNMPLSVIKDRLNEVMPEGMGIVDIAPQKNKITVIAKAEYEFDLKADDVQGVYDAVEKLLAADEILIEKKTKKGIKTVDLKPDTEMVSLEKAEGAVHMVMRLPAGTKTNYNPTLFVEALRKSCEIPFEMANIRRTGILCENNEKFS